MRLTTRAWTLIQAASFTLMGFALVYLVLGLLAGWGWFAVITAAFAAWLGIYGMSYADWQLRLRADVARLSEIIKH